VLVAGKDAGAVAEAAAKLDGVAKVLHADGDALKAARRSDGGAVVSIADGYATPPGAGLHLGQEPDAAHRRQAGCHADLRHHRRLKVADTFVRPIYAGNAIMTVKSSDAKKVITVRPTAFAAAAMAARPAVETVDAPAPAVRCRPSSAEELSASPTARS
jgi:electron transfer flavoprotein alpha subunit